MPLCRFYELGNCRYGKKCWFDHVDPVHGVSITRGGYSNQDELHQNEDKSNSHVWTRDQNSPTQDRSPMSYNRDDYTPGDDQRGGSEEFCGNQNRLTLDRSPMRCIRDEYPGYSHRGGSEEYYGDQAHYGHQSHRSTEQYSYDHEYGLGSRPLQGNLSSLQDHKYSGSQNYSRELDEYHGSKDPESQPRGEDVQDPFYKCICADIIDLEHHQEWKLTSYGPHTKHGSFAGWYDHSPEELRLAAYQARDQACGEQYLVALSTLLQQAKHLRQHLNMTEHKEKKKIAEYAIEEYRKQSPLIIHCCPDDILNMYYDLSRAHLSTSHSESHPFTDSMSTDVEMELASDILTPGPPCENILESFPLHPGA